jgi:hypothetical protein
MAADDKKNTMSKKELLALGLMNVLPSLLGAAVAGPEAGAAGAAASMKGNEVLMDFNKLDREDARAREKANAEAVAKEEARRDQQQFQKEQQQERLSSQAQQNDLTRALTAESSQTNREMRRDVEMERKIEKLQGKTQSFAELNAAIRNFEGKLPGKLSDLNAEGSKLTKDGKAVDLPGVSLPGLGRVGIYSTDARQLETAMASIFNKELKDRSGAAVTTAEMERLKGEFASGKFNTEAEMIQAVKDYEKMAAVALANAEAGFKPEVLEEYASRGGVTSQQLGKGQQQQQQAPATDPKARLEQLRAKHGRR